MPILRSGSFILWGFQMTDHGALLDGDTAYENPSHDPTMEGLWGWQNFGTIFSVPYPTAVQFTGPFFLDTTTEGNGWEAGAPPPGFNIHTGLAGPSLHTDYNLGCSPTDFGLDGNFDGAGMFGKCGPPNWQNDDDLLVYIELLDPVTMHLTNTVGLVGGGISKTGPWSTPSTGIRITGGYDILAWWWKLPDKTPCGENNTPNPRDSVSHLVLSIDQPETPDGAFGEFEKLDPDDPDAAPQPIIKFINPTAGRAGTDVEINGEGFGDDANVQFDGTDADLIVVHSQYRITCKAPMHSNGYANIVVINVDGVTS